MKLLTLFWTRLLRHHVFSILFCIVLGLMIALVYRNALVEQELRLQDRHFVTSIKQRAENLLYDEERALSEEEEAYYKTQLEHATHYLDTEYRQGKSQEVLQSELALYTALKDWTEKGNASSSSLSPNELNEKIVMLSSVLQTGADFQYTTAPKDMYLTLLQVLTVGRFLVPLLCAVLTLWLLASDITQHRGLLFINGITPLDYSLSLVSLVFITSISLFLLLYATLYGISLQQSFSFQLDYPILEYSKSLSTSPVHQILQSFFLDSFLTTLLCCLAIAIISVLAIRQKR